MEVPSLKPALGIELFKLVLLRESYVRKLTQQLLSLRSSQIDLGIVGLIDLLRETSIQVVEAIDEWEKAQVDYPNITQFTWNGQNYLEKLCHDLDFMNNIPQIRDWLDFDLIGNPFIVPPEALTARIARKDAYIIFGKAPEFETHVSTKTKSKFKSPYLAPIINDPEVFSNLSAKSKLDKEFKLAQEVKKQEKDKDETNLYQCFLSPELLQRIKGSLKKLAITNFGTSALFSTFSSFLEEREKEKEMGMTFRSTASTEYLKEEQSSFVDQNLIVGQHLEDRPDPYLFETLKTNFLNDLSVSGGRNNNVQLKNNDTSVDYIYQELSSSTKVWAPHELQLQRQVERRGGELFVLTVAGTKGRLKDPKRRTRFERLENDLFHLTQLSDHFGMIIEDLLSELYRLMLLPEFSAGFQSNNPVVAAYLNELQTKMEARRDVQTRLEFTRTLHNHFKLVAEGGKLTDIEYQRERHKLESGQAREQDQLLSMRLEETMVRKMQRLVRRSFGRVLRKAQNARRLKAAIKIQSTFRMSLVNKDVKLRIKQVRLAVMVQRLYRIKQAEALRKQLILEALQRHSAHLIQRVYRGSRGRRRLQLKRQFIRALGNAKRVVSLLELKPSDVEYLADAIEDYVRDYSSRLPIHVLTILRGILYLFNGTNSEVVLICNDDGYSEKKYIHSGTSSWSAMKLILRRKGRFLRRLRALIQNSCLPNPSKVVMSEECKFHLRSIYDNIKIEYFQSLGKARHCMEQLYLYLTNIYIAFGLQPLFPEYFEAGLPSWFRTLMWIRENFDRSEIEKRLETNANRRIEDVKRMHAKEGKKYSHISHAVQKNQIDYDNAITTFKNKKKKFQSFMKELVESEQKQVLTLDAIVRAKSLARDVSEGDLKEYMKAALIPDEEHIRDLQYALDAKTIGLIQAKTELITSKDMIIRNQTFRDFDKQISLKGIMESASTLGKIKGDLLILLESWSALVTEIGGIQYIKDLKEENLERYLTIKQNAHHLLKERREILNQMEIDLTDQYKKLYKLVLDTNSQQIGKKWDIPVSVEVEHEDLENRECCKRDYDLEFRKRRQMEIITVKEVYPWMPMIIVLDAKLPRNYIRFYFENLKKYKFHFFDLDEILASSEMNSLEKEQEQVFHKKNNWEEVENESVSGKIHQLFQDVFHQKSNIVLVANRGLHKLSYLSFDSFIFSLTQILIPTPRVAFIGSQESYRCDPNFDKLHFENPFLLELMDFRWTHRVKELNYDDINSYDLYYGKFKRLADYIRSLLFQKKTTSYGIKIQKYFQVNFFKDFQDFCQSLKETLKTLREKGKDLVGQSPLDIGSKSFQDLLLAHNLAIIWKLFKAPIIRWSWKDVFLGAKEFRLFLSRINFEQLCEYFDLKQEKYLFSHRDDFQEDHFYYHQAREVDLQLRKNDEQFQSTWRKLNELDYYQSPFRSMIVSWISSVRGIIRLEMIDCDKSHVYDYFTNPTTQAISLFLLNRSVRDIEVANIFNALLSDRVIYQKHSPVWRLYYNRDCMDSVIQQSLGSVTVGDRKPSKAEVPVTTTLQPIPNTVPKEENLPTPDFSAIDTAPSTSTKFDSPTAEESKHSDVVIYHNGEDIYLELTIYLDPDFLKKTFDEKSLKLFKDIGVITSNSNSKSTKSKKNKNQTENLCRFVTLIHSDDLVQQLQPNYTEIFEGNLAKVMKAAAKNYYAMLSHWAVLDSIGGQLELSLIRARYLVLSKLGIIGGYFVRLEIYEEKFGEIQILIFGLDKAQQEQDEQSHIQQQQFQQRLKGGINNNNNKIAEEEDEENNESQSMIYQLRIKKAEITQLLAHCDTDIEKDKLEALDSLAMAYIFTDRLEITPSQNWYLFLRNGELIPKSIPASLKLSTRLRRGPGRFVGSQLINLRKMYLQLKSTETDATSTTEENQKSKCRNNNEKQKYLVLLTIYEINSANNLHELRIVLYHFIDGKTVEYRISAMERMMLFKDNEPIINQIINRLRLVYCNLQLNMVERKLLEIPELKGIDLNNDLLIKDYEVEGDKQYEIALTIDEEEEDEDNQDSLEEDEEDDEDKESLEMSILKKNKKEDEDGQYGFGLYFDRSSIKELYGNLVVSVILEVNRRGFLYIVFDPRTFTEVFRFVPFAQMAVLVGKNLDDIELDISNLDESIAYDLMDECIGLVELDDHDEEGLVLYVQGDSALVAAFKEQQKSIAREVADVSPSKRQTLLSSYNEDEDEILVLARLKELSEEIALVSKGKRREMPTAYRVTIDILKCQDLARLGAFGSRNAFCVLRLNMREIGRTGIVKSTTNPVFLNDKNHSISMHFAKESLLFNASIEIEVYDTDARGSQTDYLGHVKLTGETLFNLIEKGMEVSFNLQPSKRISEHENRYVKGSILLSGKKAVLQNKNANLALPEKSSNRKDSQDMTENTYMLKGKDLIVSPDASLNPHYKSIGIYFIQLSHSLFQQSRPPSRSTVVLKTLTQEQLSYVVIVYFNSFEIHRFTIDPAKEKSKPHRQYHVEENKHQLDPFVPVEFRIPDNLPIAVCDLKIAFFQKYSRSRPELLGTIHLNGFQLKEYMKEVLSYANNNKQSSPEVKEVEFQTSHFDGKQTLHENGKLQLYPTLFQEFPVTYKVILRAGRNLPKADFLGKSDPFVKIYFNHKYVGQTDYHLNTINPNWIGKNEEHHILLPPFMKAEDCELEFQVFDYDKFSESDLLGVRVLNGEALTMFLRLSSTASTTMSKAEVSEQQKKWKEKFGCEFNSNHKSVHFPIQKSAVLKQSIVPRGDIEIAIQQIPYEQLPHSLYYHPGGKKISQENNESKETKDNKEKEKEREIEFQKEKEKWFAEREKNRSVIEQEILGRGSELEFFYLSSSFSAVSYRIYVVSAKGLANADTFGKSDPFVKVWFNGRKLGLTKVIQDTLNPVWNEYFDFTIAMSQTIESCYLEFEIYDEDNQQESEFLGSFFLDGKKMGDLLQQTHINRDLRKDQYSFLPFFELQKLAAAKDNRFVKGFIQLGLERIEESEETRTLKEQQLFQSQMDSENEPGVVPIVSLEEPRSVHDRATINLNLSFSSSYLLLPSASPSASNAQEGKQLAESILNSLSKDHNLYLFVVANGQLWYSFKGKVIDNPYQKTHLEIRWLFNENIKKTSFLVTLPEEIPLENNILQFFLLSETDNKSLNAADHPILPSMFAANYSFLSGCTLTGRTLFNFINAKDLEENKNALGGSFASFQQNIPLFSMIMQPNWSEYLYQLTSFSSVSHTPSYLLCQCDKREIKRLQIYLNRFVPIKKKTYEMISIESDLDEEKKKWSHYFDGTEKEFMRTGEEGEEEGGNEEKEERGPEDGKEGALSRFSKLNPQHLSKLVQQRPGKRPLDNQDRIAPLQEQQPPPPTTTEDQQQLEQQQVTKSTAEKVQRIKTELAPMDFTLTVRSRLEEDHRVYWRGKLLPKNIIFSNEKAKQAIIASRSSRLLRTKNIHEMEVMADVHYLQDLGETTVANEDLPLCVREIVSQGPGLIQRVFRMELLTNTGILLGTADIEDSKEDFLRCIGAYSQPILYQRILNSKNKEDWDMQEIFEWIAKERMIFDMMSAGGGGAAGEKKEKESQRREGIVQMHAGENAEGKQSGSVITLIRDDMDLVHSNLIQGTTAALGKEVVSPPGAGDGVAPHKGSRAFISGGTARKKTARSASTLPAVKEGDGTEGIDDNNSIERLAKQLLPPVIDELKDEKDDEDDDDEDEEEFEEEVDEVLGGEKSSKSKKRKRIIDETLHNELTDLFWSNYLSANQRITELLADPTNKIIKSFKKHWIRVYTKTQRITGKSFRSIIFLSGIHDSFLQFYKLPNGLDKYFRSYPNQSEEQYYNFDGLKELIVFIFCVDSLTKKVYEMRILGKQLIPWLKNEFAFPNLFTKFRRNKFCAALVPYITLTYLPNEDFRVHFLSSFSQRYNSGAGDEESEEDEEEEEEDQKEGDKEGQEEENPEGIDDDNENDRNTQFEEREEMNENENEEEQEIIEEDR
jgi:hypothetical protein